MKASLKEVLEWAEARNCAVGAFNTPTYENVVAVISAAEKLGTPVIISHAELHEAEIGALVMHGGSGVSPEDCHTAISCGIRKINYYSYMARAGRNAVAAKLAAGDVTFFHVLAAEATKAMEADAARAMGVFISVGAWVSMGVTW